MGEKKTAQWDLKLSILISFRDNYYTPVWVDIILQKQLSLSSIV